MKLNERILNKSKCIQPLKHHWWIFEKALIGYRLLQFTPKSSQIDRAYFGELAAKNGIAYNSLKDTGLLLYDTQLNIVALSIVGRVNEYLKIDIRRKQTVLGKHGVALKYIWVTTEHRRLGIGMVMLKYALISYGPTNLSIGKNIHVVTPNASDGALFLKGLLNPNRKIYESNHRFGTKEKVEELFARKMCG